MLTLLHFGNRYPITRTTFYVSEARPQMCLYELFIPSISLNNDRLVSFTVTLGWSPGAAHQSAVATFEASRFFLWTLKIVSLRFLV